MLTGDFIISSEVEAISGNGTISCMGGIHGINVTGIYIPGTIKKIQGGTFCHNFDELTKVVIGSSVETIDDYAFAWCGNLTKIEIPDSVTKIGNGVFSGCYSLGEIIISNENTNYSSENGILFDKSKTTLIEYPICKNDEKYVVPNTITQIESGAFGGNNYLQSIEIPDSVTQIASDAFSNCNNLKEIVVADGNSNYSTSDGIMFDKNKSQLIYFPNGKELMEYAIPDSVIQIADYAFLGCQTLTSIDIPNSVKKIGKSTFEQCKNLITINGGDNITSIGEGCFLETKWLNNQPNGIVYIGKVLYCYIGTITSDKTNIQVKDGIEGITGSGLNCSGYSLTSVILPKSIKTIGDFAFGNSYVTINYKGSEEEWKLIEFGDENLDQINKVNYNYTGE